MVVQIWLRTSAQVAAANHVIAIWVTKLHILVRDIFV